MSALFNTASSYKLNANMLQAKDKWKKKKLTGFHGFFSSIFKIFFFA